MNKLLQWSRSGREISAKALLAGWLFCVAAAVGIRLLTWQMEPVLSRDGAGYVLRAQEIREQRSGVRPEKIYPPLTATPHCIYSSCLSLGRDALPPQTSGVAANLILGSLLPLILGGCAQLLWKRRDLSLACAAFAALFPPFVGWSIEVQREMPHLFFSGLFFLFLLLYARKSSWYWAAFSGGAAALSLLCRYEGFECLVLGIIFGIIRLWKEPQKYRSTLLHGGLFLFVFLLVLVIVFELAGIEISLLMHSIWQKFHGYLFR